jgi:hypothetical protein
MRVIVNKRYSYVKLFSPDYNHYVYDSLTIVGRVSVEEIHVRILGLRETGG